MDVHDILKLNTANMSPLTELAGAVRVGATRVTLDSVIGAYRQGYSAGDILGHFPDLKLEDVYTTLLLYLRHREQIEAYLHERSKQAGLSRNQWESNADQRRLRDRLLETMKRAS